MRHPIEIIVLPAKQKGKKQSYSSGIYFDGTKYTRTNTTNSKCREQHAYGVVSRDIEELKVGDWWIYLGKDLEVLKTNAINQCKTETQRKLLLDYDCRKIVATTDRNLLKEINIPFGQPNHHTNAFNGTIIQRKGKHYTYLSRFKKGLLKKFVANPNGKWEVDYKYAYEIQSSPNKAEIRLDIDDTVIITPAKERMYTKKELRDAVYCALTSDGPGVFNMAWPHEDVVHYINKNL